MAIGNARFGGDVRECSVAVVVIEDVAAEAGDVKIGPAVVIVVADRTAHGQAGFGQPRFLGHVGEGAVVIVVVENTQCGLAFQSHVDGRRIGEIDVGPTVAIVVKDDHAASHRFEDVLLFLGRCVSKGDSSLRGIILQLRDGAIGAFERFGARRRRTR